MHFQNKAGTTDLDTVPEAEGSKPEGRLTRHYRFGGTGVPEDGRGRVKPEEYE